jgi:hypothetical protein
MVVPAHSSPPSHLGVFHIFVGDYDRIREKPWYWLTGFLTITYLLT